MPRSSTGPSSSRTSPLFNTCTLCFEALCFNQDIGGWNVSSVIRMNRMFEDAENFDKSLRSWDVSSVARMDFMFHGAREYNQNLCPWGSKVRGSRLSRWPGDVVRRDIFHNSGCVEQETPGEECILVMSGPCQRPPICNFEQKCFVSTENWCARC